jgi:hypothetical protein
MVFLSALALGSLPPVTLRGQENSLVEKTGCESSDIHPVSRDVPLADAPPTGSGVRLAQKAIRYYQRKISTLSVDRCPFYVSCSNYASRTIDRHGLLIGTALFIDRYFYRENRAAFAYYDLKETPAFVLKLDDSVPVTNAKTTQ